MFSIQNVDIRIMPSHSITWKKDHENSNSNTMPKKSHIIHALCRMPAIQDAI